MQREDVTEKVILIRVNRYHYGMTEFELYEQTRRSWKINPERARQVEYAIAVYGGLILEVYKVAAWFPAYTPIVRFLFLKI